GGVRVLLFETPNLIQLWRDFRCESGGTLQNCLTTGIVRHHQGVRDVELVARARECDVPEAAFFVFAFGVAQGAGRGELAVGGPDDEDGAPVETFGLMN